jgi:hypothetical protein
MASKVLVQLAQGERASSSPFAPHRQRHPQEGILGRREHGLRAIRQIFEKHTLLGMWSSPTLSEPGNLYRGLGHRHRSATE